MDARITDPEGPLWSRAFVPTLAILMLPLGLGAMGGRFWFVMVAVVLALLARALTPRRRPRRGTLECKKGWVGIRKAGILTQTIRASSVLGATMTRTSIALSLKGRRLPVVIELASHYEMVAVRDALGIGANGMGTVEWSLRAHPIEQADLVARVGLALVTSAALLASVVFEGRRWPWWIDHVDTVLTIAFPLIIVLYVVRRAWPRESIELHDGGVSIRAPNLRTFIALRELQSIDVVGRDIVMKGKRRIELAAPPSRWLASGMTADERTQLAAFVSAAIERDKAGEKDVDVRTVESMRRGDESVRAWLQRLDAMGVSPEGAGYRASTLDVGVLWRVFEDPDEEPDLRAASARMLSRIVPDEMKVRVAPILSTVRDAMTRKRIEATLDPAHAAELLEEIEAEERVMH